MTFAPKQDFRRKEYRFAHPQFQGRTNAAMERVYVEDPVNFSVELRNERLGIGWQRQQSAVTREEGVAAAESLVKWMAPGTEWRVVAA